MARTLPRTAPVPTDKLVGEIARWMERHHILYLKCRQDEGDKYEFMAHLVHVVLAAKAGNDINNGNWDL